MLYSMNALKGQRLLPKDQVKERVVTVRLTDSQFSKLQRIGQKEERSVSFLVRKAVESYLSSKR